MASTAITLNPGCSGFALGLAGAFFSLGAAAVSLIFRVLCRALDGG